MKYRIVLSMGVAAAVAFGVVVLFRGEWLVRTALQARFSPRLTLPQHAPPSSQAEADLQDLDDLSYLLELDRSGSPVQRAEFSRQLADLRGHIEGLPPAVRDMAVARLVALLGNGHTAAHILKYPLVPIRAAWFDEGLFVVAADAGHAALLGRRIMAIDGHDVDDAVTDLQPYFSGTREHKRHTIALALLSPALLQAIWPETDGTYLTLGMSDGKGARAIHALEPSDAPVTWLPGSTIFRHMLGEPPPPSIETHPLDGNGVYLRLNQILDDSRGPLPSQLAAFAAGMPAGGWHQIVLDLRFDGGGDYTRTVDFTRTLPSLLSPDGTLWLLSGNDTFSAAIVTLARAKYFTGDRAHVIGERVGDRDRFWGEIGEPLRLRNSGTLITYATGMHDWVRGCYSAQCFWLNYVYGVAAGSLEPEENVAWSFTDFAAGRDTVLERVRAHRDR